MKTNHYSAKIVKAKDCGLEVYRLLVWRNGTLHVCKTHMSEAGARSQWDVYRRTLELQTAARTLVG